MNQQRYAWGVGLFAAVGLALTALLVLNFSEGITLFNKTYQLQVVLPSSAGLKPAADVMMSGVPIGKVVKSELGPDGRSVGITLRILSKFKIRSDAVFQVESLGFLGDQYIAVTPLAQPGASTNKEAGLLKDGDTVQGKAAFDMFEAVASTSDLLAQARQTIKDLDQAITNVNRTVLSDETLKAFSLAISNFASVTEIAVRTVQDADDLVHTNSPAVAMVANNLVAVSEKFNLMADQIEQVITTNKGEVNQAVSNLRDTTASVKQLAAGLQAGKGLAGGLLTDEAMKAQAVALFSNANAVASQFATFGSNLNQRGIWSMLWKPKHTGRSPDPAR
jgi:phospholipid/cholesterol/gamma-HCH transport system substrate-binding protein